jgi:hypothetical protein
MNSANQALKALMDFEDAFELSNDACDAIEDIVLATLKLSDAERSALISVMEE